jgi:hypothetical protein
MLAGSIVKSRVLAAVLGLLGRGQQGHSKPPRSKEPKGGHGAAATGEKEKEVTHAAQSPEGVRAPLTPGDIGVVTPYLAQVRSISDALRRAGVPVVEGASSEGATPPPFNTGGGSVGQGGAVEVCSVDGFQGRQKRAIVVSAVRSNTRGEVGFLGDARRLNVALTRAESALVVVCDPLTVRHDGGGWGAWGDWAVRNELVVMPHKLGVGRDWEDANEVQEAWRAAVGLGLLRGL